MEQSEASEKLEATLNEIIPELDDYEEGDLLIDWVCIGYTSNPDAEKDSMYPMFMANSEMPTYRVRGLLHTALKYLDED